jgi:transposase InsO family protein
MIIAKQLNTQLSLRKSLCYVGISHNKWYHTKSPRNISINKTVTKTVQKIGSTRPTYGTRRMAASVSRELGLAVNRKQIRRIFHKLGWITPTKTKKQIMASKKKLFKSTAPNQLWQTDMTYVWCGIDGWCYCFNVVDTFSRKWISYTFDVTASKDAAAESIIHAIASEKPDCTKLTIRTDNGSQYVSKKFREAVMLLGARQEFIWHHTPQQNGHVESFHKTLKKEYLWPHEFENFQSAQVIIAKAFEDYNDSRIHSALGYITPNEFLAQWEMKHK